MIYTFDWMVTSYYAPVLWPNANGNYAVARERVRLYPTRIEDRHGNWVSYTWVADKLQRIESKDGRLLTVEYNPAGRVVTVKDNSAPQRVWRYGYEGSSLRSVTQPDNSQWQFDFGIGIGAVNYDTNTTSAGYDTALACNWMRKLLANERTVTITHPSGAIGTFTFDVKRHGRAHVESFCNSDTDTRDARSNYPDTPARFDTWSLVRKRIEGPGLPGSAGHPSPTPYQWVYSYVLPVGNFMSSSCANGCPTTKSVEVSAPDGSRTTHTYGIQFARTDNQLLSVRTVDLSGAEIRREDYAYVLDGQATPFPDRIGSTPQWYANDSYFGERLRPQKQRTIVQGGVSFTSTTSLFDVWAYPRTVSKSSSLGSKTEVSAYEHNTSKWVLGQLRMLTVDNTLASEVVYDPATALPIRTYAFGKLQQSIDYYDAPGQDGNLRSVTDGNNREIIFSDYHRGIARRVDYPTGKSQSATVNNLGSITSITDELGNTSYFDYYTDGRLWKIRYPTGDTPAWNERVFSFQPWGSEYGIPAGHWKQTVTQGTAVKETVYDALWRPVLARESDSSAGADHFSVRRHDFAGREIFVSYPRDSLAPSGSINAVNTGTSSYYDALGRLVSTSQTSELGSIGTSVTYATTGFKKTVRNGRNKATTYSFKAFDEPTEEFPELIVAPETLSVSISRDAFGKPLSITRSGTQQSNGVNLPVLATRSYVYDPNQQLCKTIEPEIGATVIDYDGAGNVAWTAAGLPLPNTSTCDRTAAGVAALRSERTYDPLNRPLTTTFADGSPSIARTYHDDGQLKTMAAGAVVWTYGYNNRRLPTTETLALDGRTYALENRYSANGHLKTLVYPDAVEVDYAPNALGEPTAAGNALKSYASQVSTWPNGAIKAFTYGNGVTHTLTQNARGLPWRSVDNLGVLDDTYSYDANANVESIVDTVNGATRTMQYDDLDRLESMIAGAPWSASSYVYDALDNVRTSTVGSRAYTHSYTPSNLLEALKVGGTTVVGYNYLRGNLTQRGAQTFVFDHANRLASKAGQSPKSDEQYAYDGHGRRVKVVRTLGGETRHMVYSQSGQLRFETDLVSGKTTDYIYLGGSLVAREEAGVAAVPGAPAVTAPATNTTGTYAVSWSAPTGATSYVLEENTNDLGWVVRYTGTATSTVMTLHANGTYRYRAKACTSTCSAASAVVTTLVSMVAQPSAPTSIVASPNPSLTGSFELRWPPVTSATLYRVQENANSAGWASTYVYSGATRAFAISSKPSGSYQYRVEACSASCSLPSPSTTVSVTVTAGVAAAPTLSVPTSSTTGSYTVSWSIVAGATRYELQELGPTDWAWVTRYSAGTLLAQAFTQPNGSYSYRVRTCNAIGCGDFGAASSITVVIQGIPSPPNNLTATPSSNTTGTTTLTWAAVPNATRYVLRRASPGVSPVIAYDGPGLIREQTGLALGLHEFKVKACNGPADATCGAYSGAIIFTRESTAPLRPDAPISLTLTPTTSTTGSYTLSWVPASTGGVVTSYSISESIDGNPAGCSDPCDVNAPATTLAFSGRGNGTYRYWVQACGPGGCSASPAPASVIVAIPGGPERPAFISTSLSNPLTCTASPRTVPLTWGAVDSATRYEVRVINGTTGVERLINLPGPGTSTSITSHVQLQESTEFTHEVRACNAATPSLCSAWRGTVTVCVGSGGERSITATTVRYLHTDALGSPVAETDQGGAVLKRTRYEAYGAPTDGIYADGPGYTGHVTDSATRLTYMQQRYYDPIAARFLSLDPVVTDASTGVGFNRYVYANNNPYKFVDPDGRTACPTGEGNCIDSPKTESGTTPQSPISSQQRTVDGQVKAASQTGQLSDGTKLNLASGEQGFKASDSGTSSNPMEPICQRCSDGSTREGGLFNTKNLDASESGGHTHNGGLVGLPGPEDGALANATGKSAYVISERGAFSVEKTGVGYRIRVIDGARPSSRERSDMRKTIDGYNKNSGGSGLACQTNPGSC